MRKIFRIVNGILSAMISAQPADKFPPDMKTLKDRILERLEATGKSARAVSIEATGKPDLVRKILNDSIKSPNAVTMRQMAKSLETNVDWLLSGEGRSDALDDASPTPANAAIVKSTTAKKLPVFGLAAGSIQGALTMTDDPVDWVPCPPALADAREIYVLWVTGESMAPAYEPGQKIYVSKVQPIRRGDYVVVQESRDGGTATSIKRFVSKNHLRVVTEQYNPAGTVEFTSEHVREIDRVIPWDELITS
ncbi:MAG: S24 family peptidase [Pseudomonadota bacterium]